MHLGPFLGITALLTVAPSAFTAADTSQYESEGAEPNHGALRFVPPHTEPRSYDALLEEVRRWSARYNPGLSEEDATALADWLNCNFYKLEKNPLS